MRKAKLISEFIKDIDSSDYKNETFKELSEVVEDVFNQINLKSKVDQTDLKYQLYLEVLELQLVIKDLTSEMYLLHINTNGKIESAFNILKRK